MSNYKIADRYAKSLMLLAKEQNALTNIKDDMELMGQTITNSRELIAVMNSPIIASHKKIAILEQLFGNNFHKVSKSFMAIIVKKRREMHLAEIAQAYVRLYNAAMGITTAKLVTAHEMDANMQKAILAQIGLQTGKEVQLSVIQNPDLIGGFVLTVGDKQIDTSVKRQIQNLRKQFTDNPYIQKL